MPFTYIRMRALNGSMSAFVAALKDRPFYGKAPFPDRVHCCVWNGYALRRADPQRVRRTQIWVGIWVPFGYK